MFWKNTCACHDNQFCDHGNHFFRIFVEMHSVFGLEADNRGVLFFGLGLIASLMPLYKPRRFPESAQCWMWALRPDQQRRRVVRTRRCTLLLVALSVASEERVRSMVALILAARLASRVGIRRSALSRNQSGCIRVRWPKVARAHSVTEDWNLDHARSGVRSNKSHPVDVAYK